MRVLRGRNVNDLYLLGRALLDSEGIKSSSRAGDVLVCPWPVVSVYERPTERVLFDSLRDANPFFHIFESLWMLSGSDDATWLDQFVGDFSARFAEKGGVMHGAYGKRWRCHFPEWDRSGTTVVGKIDQLSEIVKILRKNPEDRRAVMQMWDTSSDLSVDVKDVPCNTQIYPRVRDGVLDITVCCRSNDIVFGAYGANAVHFSVLQEYLASGVGARVGTMYQLSNNFHGYVDVLERKPLSDASHPINPYQQAVYPLPMVTDFEHFDADVAMFMSEWHEMRGPYRNSWFDHVAEPMYLVHRLWKNGDKVGARKMLDLVSATDWRRAALEWMMRRGG